MKPPRAVHDVEKNKSIKAEALLLAHLIQGGAELQRGRHHMYLIQLGSLQGLPWELPAKKKKGKEMGLQACLTKTFNRDLCPCWIHLISQLSECWSSQTVSLQIWGGTDFLLTWAGVRKKKILSKAKQSVPFFCCSLCWWVFGEQTDQEQPSANLQGWKTKPTEHAKNCHSLNDHLRQAPKAN